MVGIEHEYHIANATQALHAIVEANDAVVTGISSDLTLVLDIHLRGRNCAAGKG